MKAYNKNKRLCFCSPQFAGFSGLPPASPEARYDSFGMIYAEVLFVVKLGVEKSG